MSDDIPCNNCGVKFSDVEQLRKDAYDSDQDFWRMNELFIKTQTQLKEADELIDYCLDETVMHSFDKDRLREYKAKYNKDKG